MTALIERALEARDAGAYAGKRVVILGLGQFGGQIEAARYFVRAGARVLATDLKGPEKLARALAALEGLPIELRLGGHREEDLLSADLVVVSPAVPKNAPVIELIRARGVPMTTELTLTLAHLRAPFFGVTGSNGKSTVTALLGAALAAASGRKVFVGGNIGHPLLNELEGIGGEDRAVLELSSFQLEDVALALERGTLARFRPALALLTNLTPNHLDRHGTMEAYAEAKRSLVRALEGDGVAVLNREDPVIAGFSEGCRGRVVTFGLDPRFPGAGSFARGGLAFYRDEAGREEPLFALDALPLPGRHNALNALAVAAAIAALPLERAAAADAIVRFGGLRDRLEPAGERGGVRFVNDSKATTPEAAAAGLASYGRGLTLIAGGTDKGMDFTPFARAAHERAARVLLIGRTRERLREWIEGAARDAGGAPPPIRLCETLEEAVSSAARETPPGQVVLFSPACASYDMFLSFEERGERFRAAVRALPA